MEATDFSIAEALTVLCSADVVSRRLFRLMEKAQWRSREHHASRRHMASTKLGARELTLTLPTHHISNQRRGCPSPAHAK